MNDPWNHVAVLGLGGSGEAAALLLREEGVAVTLLESSETPQILARAGSLRMHGVSVILGEPAERDSSKYDVAVISPGIDPSVPLVQNVLRKGTPLISEIELAYTRCACPVVAITGTNGKTTTTELTATLLQGAGVRTIACGNIGLPFSSVARGSADLDMVVLEVSSFQLEAIRTFRPKVAAWLNLSANHLDRYPGMAEYRAAKLRIFENQSASDCAVVNAVNDLPPLPASVVTFSAVQTGADFTLRDSLVHFRGEPVLDQAATKLPGVHNAENIMAALGIGWSMGLDLKRLAAGVSDYSPPQHRCEHVRDLGGVRWVNDSKSTNLDAMDKAIRSQERPVVLIAGGKDKGFEFDAVAGLVREKVRAAVLIGEMRQRIAKSWSGVTCETCESLDEAVLAARKLAQAGDVVLFSPGTSSFDMFRSYVERGDIFKSAVNKLSS